MCQPLIGYAHMRTTPFYDRTSVLNKTGLWEHWSGYLSAKQYHLSEKLEYFAVRTAAGVYDTSPLYKYRIHGRDAEMFLSRVFARDVRGCRPGRAQYTIWCDQDGFVMEDGMLFRITETEYMLTTAKPNAAYFQDLVGRALVQVDDISDQVASLAIQGPRSKAILSSVVPDLEELRPFHLTEDEIQRVVYHRVPYRLHRGPRLRAMDRCGGCTSSLGQLVRCRRGPWCHAHW